LARDEDRVPNLDNVSTVISTKRGPLPDTAFEENLMSLPDSYTYKAGSIPAYFDALLDAQAPERFSIKFLENLGFTSTHDRLLIGILKELSFLNADGLPQQRYYEFLDRSRSKQVLAEAIKDAYSDLFAVNKNANTLTPEEVTNKLRTLYAGKKSDGVIGRIASTFTALCDYADFSSPDPKQPPTTTQGPAVSLSQDHAKQEPKEKPAPVKSANSPSMGSLQYHINIVLPESRDQSVYDAIFKSLRDHLG
jgi:hypothetical protein